MKIEATKLKQDDYVHGVGIVTRVSIYSQDIATTEGCQRPIIKKLSPLARARVIAREIEETYDSVPDKVSVTFGNQVRNYNANTQLEVTRTNPDFILPLPKAA